MPLTANSVGTQVLVDTATKHVIKLVYFQASAGNESDLIKVNVATLSGRTLALTTSNVEVGQSGFVPGERVTGGTSGAIGYVVGWVPSRAAVGATGLLTLTVESGTFTTELITGASGFIATSTVVTMPPYVMDIVSIWHNISAGAVVALQFANSSANVVAVTLSGNGYIGRNEMGTALKNAIPLTNGNLYVSTAGVGIGAGYTVIVELRKGAGFAGRPVY